MTSRIRLFCLATFVTLLVSTNAWASSGYVTGTLQFCNHLGSYCPNSGTVDCTGAKYLEALYHTYRPVRYAEVTLVGVINQGANETVYSIGEGTTNASGNYTMSWSISRQLQQIFI